MHAIIRYRKARTDEVVRLAEAPVLIGRVAECGVLSEDDTVTRRHACIYLEDGRHWIKDLGSDNGTWVNGTLIRAPRRLVHGDKIQCGRLALEYLVDEG